MKIIKFVLLSGLFFLGACNKEDITAVINPVRIVKIEIPCRTFNNTTKTIELEVLDVLVDSTKKIFNVLYENNFPIYAAVGYENRNIVNGSKPSLHAYGAAIDINEMINPYYSVSKGRKSIEPTRFINRKKDHAGILSHLNYRGVVDESEIDVVVDIITQEEGSDDWFINREINREGMTSPKEALVFAQNGFTIWGGDWKDPMDFMHFQTPRGLVEKIASVSKEEGEMIWQEHLDSIKNRISDAKNP